MKQKLLDELMEVSEEEQKYLDGQGDIERQLYVKEKIEEIDRELLLKRGQLITVRPHSRFVDFPEHRHNYVEIMYVAQGSITHCIEGKELVLHKGDVLMLNQQVVHSIKRADYQDIGINFIALPEFFEVPLSMLGEENVLARFVTSPYGKHGGIHAARICERRYHKPIFHGNCIFASSESSGKSEPQLFYGL